jgi:hypothetical protein
LYAYLYLLCCKQITFTLYIEISKMYSSFLLLLLKK